MPSSSLVAADRSRGLEVKYYALREPTSRILCVEKGSSRRFYEPGGTRVHFESWAAEEFGARFAEVTEDKARELVYGSSGTAGAGQSANGDSLAAELERSAGRSVRDSLQNAAAFLVGIGVFLGLLYLARTLSGARLDEWSVAALAKVFVVTTAGPLLAGSLVAALARCSSLGARLYVGLVFALAALWLIMVLNWLGAGIYDHRLLWIDHVGAIPKMFLLALCAGPLLRRESTRRTTGAVLGFGIAFLLLCVDIIRGWFVSSGSYGFSRPLFTVQMWASLTWVVLFCAVSFLGTVVAAGLRSARKRRTQ